MDGSEYKHLIKEIETGRFLKNPQAFFQQIIEEVIKRQSTIPTTTYESSLEALNRDSCINVAKLAKKDCRFVFISAADTIAPMF